MPLLRLVFFQLLASLSIVADERHVCDTLHTLFVLNHDPHSFYKHPKYELLFSTTVNLCKTATLIKTENWFSRPIMA